MCECYACRGGLPYHIAHPSAGSNSYIRTSVGYVPANYTMPQFVENSIPAMPSKVTINWGEVIAGAIIGAVVSRFIK